MALGHLGLGVFLLGGLYMTYTTLSIYDWRPGVDAAAYWRTGQEPDHLWYRVTELDGRYLYAPVFAQILTPVTGLPWHLFIAIWVAAETTAFAWLLRPLGWKWVVPILFWLAPELLIGNVLGFIGVAVVLGFRYPGTWALPILTKPPLGVGLIWFLVRREYRQLGVALGTTVLITAISLMWKPTLWLDWWQFLQHMSTNATDVDAQLLYVRFVLSAMLVFYAAKTCRPWLIPVALLMATPVFAGGPSFAILAATPRLWVMTATRSRPIQTHSLAHEAS